jgi:hypothetical protein
MNRYHAASPRAAMMLAAVAMTALTFGLTVLPAITDSGAPPARVEAALHAVPTAGVARQGAPIVVYGVREQQTAFEPMRQNHRAHGREG